MKNYSQLIPEKLINDLSMIYELLQDDIKGFDPDCLKEVISTIACQIQKSDGFAPLQIKILKRLVPQADKYLKGLIDLGIIIREGQYIPGEISYKYKFAQTYESKYLPRHLNNPRLQRRIELIHEELRKESVKKSVKNHAEQTKFLKLLTIDENYTDYFRNNPDLTLEQYNSVEVSATRILNGDTARCSIDDTSGRFHSIVTNMAKDLRPYLRIKGEPLANIDIKNSQPYLSTIILTNPGKVSHMTKNPAFALLLQSLKVSLKEDVKNYISLVVSGQLYEYLMSEFHKGGIPLTRQDTKRQVLRILFARNRMPKDETNRKCRQIFRDNFPTVHKIFSKVRGHEKGDKFTNFKRFAILLQRIEAYLMLDVILKRIYRELPGTVAITIHDSIMTGVLTNNVEAVRKIMVEELTYFVGSPPQIKIEGRLREKEGEEGRKRIIKQYDATTFVSYN